MTAADISSNTGDKKTVLLDSAPKETKELADAKRTNKIPKNHPLQRWDKRQRICSLVDEGDEEEEDEMASAHTAFRLQQQQQRAKVRAVLLFKVHQDFVFCASAHC